MKITNYKVNTIMKLIPNNITLENVKKSKYWDLISILVWNHYSEKKYQDESCIEITEDWCGKFDGGSSHTHKWDDPNYSEEGYVRTLNAIVITFKRSDYITHIYIYCERGNINTFGSYIEKSNKYPHYEGSKRNIDITNWMLENNLIKLV